MLVLWSGGVDSTLVLYRAIEFAESNERVRSLSISYGQQVPGTKQNKTARNKLKRLLRAKVGPFSEIEVNVDVRADTIDFMTNKGIIQPIMWAFHAFLHAADGETIQFGYIRGDDALRVMDQLEYIKGYVGSMMRKKLELDFPLIDMLKSEVIRAATEEAPWILDHAWYCEPDPDNLNIRKPCGKCRSCKIHRTALWQIEQGF